MNYDKFARPNNKENVTNVEISMTILHINLDEKQSILVVSCWLRMVMYVQGIA